MHPHSTPVDDTLTHFDTDADRGLTADEASRRLDEHGPNQLPEPPAPNPVLRFLSHFNDVLIYVLLVAAVVTAFMGHWVDTIVIAAVAVVNATIGYLQEGQAEKALQGIRDMLSPSATVRRDGGWVAVDATDVVPGDIVRLRSGDRVPATTWARLRRSAANSVSPTTSPRSRGPRSRRCPTPSSRRRPHGTTCSPAPRRSTSCASSRLSRRAARSSP